MQRRVARALRLAVAGLVGLAGAAACHAQSLRYCDRPAALSAAQQDVLLRFAAIVRAELEGSGAPLAIVARSGLDLHRFGLRYSHAGISLKASRETAWAVRQLYYACDEGRPRLFDQGLAGFVGGSDEPSSGYVSALIVPAAPAAPLERAALDNGRALALLNARYSANAYAWSLRYQNCNQWVAELLASAWGDGDASGDESAEPRARAQRWLRAHGYEPERVEVRNPALLLGAAFVPWLHRDDHPQDAVARGVYRLSMPGSIEAFVRAFVPGARRVEFCHAGRRVVVHRGWEPIAEGCVPAAGDAVMMLDG